MPLSFKNELVWNNPSYILGVETVFETWDLVKISEKKIWDLRLIKSLRSEIWLHCTEIWDHIKSTEIWDFNHFNKNTWGFSIFSIIIFSSAQFTVATESRWSTCSLYCISSYDHSWKTNHAHWAYLSGQESSPSISFKSPSVQVKPEKRWYWIGCH